MKHCQDNQRIRANPEVNTKRKTTREGASNVTDYNGIALRCSRSIGDSLLDLANKLLAKTVTLLVVPDGGISNSLFAARRKTTRSVIARGAIGQPP